GFPAPKSILDDDGPVDLSEDDNAVHRARPGTPPIHKRKPPKTSTPAEYAKHRAVMKESFPEGWAPPRKISREAMDGLRQLHHHDPDMFTTPFLAQKFRISPEAVRRILKGKWEPSKERKTQMMQKERASNAEFIRQSRLREVEELQENFAEKRAQREKTHGEVSGVNSKDVFSFD
ncbi:hypothetical protein CYLTODRAFT_418439, partial [Cylindrobasidium torrendii FP15055 ss-10]